MNDKNKEYKQKAKNISDIIFPLLKRAFKELKIIIEKAYENILKKIRLSLRLKLNLMYTSRLIGVFFSIDILLILLITLYTGYRGEIDTRDTYGIYKNFIIDNKITSEKDITDENKNIFTQLSTEYSNKVWIYDKNKEEIYTSDKIIYNNGGKQYKIYSNIYFQRIAGLNKEFSEVEEEFESIFQTKHSIYLIKKEVIEVGTNVVNIDIYKDLTLEIALGILGILIIIIIEIIILVISIIKASIRIKKILSPIDEMNKTVEEITINNIDTRLNIMGSQNELKDLANTFNKMLDRIQESYETQNQFVSDASHELRTPISVIQGYAKMLKRWGKEEKEVLEESIIAIESESESMKSLIEQLLFLARGDKNTQKFNKELFSLNDLIYEMIKETKLIDEEKHIISCDRNDEIEINADRSLLKEAVRVFIDNSIKYTKEGGVITISSYVFDNKATIIIKDTGIGIKKEDLAKIFDRFYRADKSRTRDTGGTGLGLSIAKWIIKKHRGSIEVTSKINIGTTFMIKIPLN